MKAEIKEGFDEGTNLVYLKAETSDEADILQGLWNHGVRVCVGSRWEIVLAEPRLAGLTALYLTDADLKMVHDALAKHHIKDGKLSALLTKAYPRSSTGSAKNG